MYLVDTSVWIDYLRGTDTPGVQFLEKILSHKKSFGISSIIYQEVLQGASTLKDFKNLSAYFSTQVFYHPKDPIASYQAAAEVYFNCRKRGLMIRSTIDCLIVQITIEHSLILVHSDRDFKHIQKVIPDLKLFDDMG
jgi:predicted nucleic acid-binding protein